MAPVLHHGLDDGSSSFGDNIVDQHEGAPGSERLGDTVPHVLARAGDEGNPTMQVKDRSTQPGVPFNGRKG